MKLFDRAIVRTPGKSFVNAIAQDPNHIQPDYEETLKEFNIYVDTLRQMGVTPIICPPDENCPDGNFVEDPYFVLDDKLIIRLNPGAESRQKEYATLEPYLPKNLPLSTIPSDITIDGGDILKDGHDIYIGLSKRTQLISIQFFNNLVKEYGYRVHPVEVPEGLHLKSGMTCVTHKNYVAQKTFEPILKKMQNEDPSIKYFIVPENEKHAANVLAFNDHIMMPYHCPETRAYIAKFYPSDKIHEVSTDQVKLVDGALTCSCVLLREPLEPKLFEPEPLQVTAARARL